MEYTILKMQYVEQMLKQFPNTFFIWSFKVNGSDDLKWTKPKSYFDIDKNMFWRKDNMYRTALYNSSSDELRLDLDNLNMQDNISQALEIISRLEKLGLNKYLLYMSGGKGLHIHLRYKFNLEDIDRQEFRTALYNSLGLNFNVDNTLFRSMQMFGLEGFKHRKTGNYKQLIKIKDNNIVCLNKGLEFDYLTDKYLNVISNNLLDNILLNLKHKEKANIKAIDTHINNTPVFYNNNTFISHLNRFKEIYLSLEDGKKRLLDSLTRYIYLTTKDINLTISYYKDFINSVGLNLSEDLIISRVSNTIKSMKSPAIFIYKDVLTKEEFYKTYNKNGGFEK